jgi:biopolymer transport protein ExbD
MKIHLKRARAAADGGEDEGPAVDLASLVDVSFLLLIYFLVAMTLVPAERDLATGLPGVGEPAPAVELPLVVRVTPAGEVVWGGGDSAMLADAADAPSSLPGLVASLRLAKAGMVAGGPLFMLDVAGAARQQRVIDVLNCFAGEGIERVVMLDRGE